MDAEEHPIREQCKCTLITERQGENLLPATTYFVLILLLVALEVCYWSNVIQ